MAKLRAEVVALFFLIVKQFLIEVLLDRDSFISRVQLGWLVQ